MRIFAETFLAQGKIYILKEDFLYLYLLWQGKVALIWAA